MVRLEVYGIRVLLPARFLPGITADRICGIRFSLDDEDSSVTSVIDVHLPCLSQGVEGYKDHLVEHEHIIRESQLLGLVVVLGDFNAHLGGKGGVGERNLQSMLLLEVLQ